MPWQLKQTDGFGTRSPKVFDLVENGILGRSKTCNYAFGCASVSRSHCKFNCTNNRWSVTDLGSSCGTYRNGKKLTAHKSETLNLGDKIQVGNYPNDEKSSYVELELCERVIKPESVKQEPLKQPEPTSIKNGSILFLDENKKLNSFILENSSKSEVKPVVEDSDEEILMKEVKKEIEEIFLTSDEEDDKKEVVKKNQTISSNILKKQHSLLTSDEDDDSNKKTINLNTTPPSKSTTTSSEKSSTTEVKPTTSIIPSPVKPLGDDFVFQENCSYSVLDLLVEDDSEDEFLSEKEQNVKKEKEAEKENDDKRKKFEETKKIKGTKRLLKLDSSSSESSLSEVDEAPVRSHKAFLKKSPLKSPKKNQIAATQFIKNSGLRKNKPLPANTVLDFSQTKEEKRKSREKSSTWSPVHKKPCTSYAETKVSPKPNRQSNSSSSSQAIVKKYKNQSSYLTNKKSLVDERKEKLSLMAKREAKKRAVPRSRENTRPFESKEKPPPPVLQHNVKSRGRNLLNAMRESGGSKEPESNALVKRPIPVDFRPARPVQTDLVKKIIVGEDKANTKNPTFSQTTVDVTNFIEDKRLRRAAIEEKDKLRAERQKKLQMAKPADRNEKAVGYVVQPSVLVKKNVLPDKSSNAKYHKTVTAGAQKIPVDTVLQKILDWKVIWLKQQRMNEFPPPITSTELKDLKNHYDSPEDYEETYLPLLLHETWAQIVEDFENKNNKVFDIAVDPAYEADGPFIFLHAQTVIGKAEFNNSKHPSEGDMVMLEIGIDNGEAGIRMMVFGYVENFALDGITPTTCILPQLPQNRSHSFLMKYIIKIVKRPIRLNTVQLMKIKSIYYLKPTIRQIEALLYLRSGQCLISRDIIHPREYLCQFAVPTIGVTPSPDYNEMQYKAILGCTEAVKRPYATPKILLVQGPPGTGKTYTLVGIVKSLFGSWEQEKTPKILICAPSNGGVDEICRRLIAEKEFLRKQRGRELRLVRIGQSEQIHPDVRKIELEYLVTTNQKRTQEEKITNVARKVTKLEDEIKRLDYEITQQRILKDTMIAALRNDAAKFHDHQLRRANELLERKSEELRILMRDRGKQGANEVTGNKQRLRIDLLRKADVILSTLNSCRQNVVEKMFQDKDADTFQCVIIDEASQCSEPESLMPLAYKVTKMVLIGDPMQLPATVISRTAAAKNYGRSLFERFYRYFKENGQENPILMLNEQYRMHQEICHFPSLQFYGNRLKTGLNCLRYNSPVVPYIVIDIKDSKEDTSDPRNKFNEVESAFIVKILNELNILLHSKSTVGIITPYQGQKRHIKDQLQQSQLTFKWDINTIDGFQGQERDVIVLSCVRALDNGSSIGFLKSTQRMNVALTRAKHSMIICISTRSLQTDSTWRNLINDTRDRNCLVSASSMMRRKDLHEMLKNKMFL